ncbi:hypothetical protein LZ32DRAFT_618665 [Colletotrichum eremochloae]|nr:hypothetical protein LZ32DRAFT_618665 [Colletotrichum eremochloae]
MAEHRAIPNVLDPIGQRRRRRKDHPHQTAAEKLLNQARPQEYPAGSVQASSTQSLVGWWDEDSDATLGQQALGQDISSEIFSWRKERGGVRRTLPPLRRPPSWHRLKDYQSLAASRVVHESRTNVAPRVIGTMPQLKDEVKTHSQQAPNKHFLFLSRPLWTLRVTDPSGPVHTNSAHTNSNQDTKAQDILDRDVRLHRTILRAAGHEPARPLGSPIPRLDKPRLGHASWHASSMRVSSLLTFPPGLLQHNASSPPPQTMPSSLKAAHCRTQNVNSFPVSTNRAGWGRI